MKARKFDQCPSASKKGLRASLRMKLLAGTLCENKQKWPGFSQHGHDRADPHPPRRQEAPRLNYALAGAVNKLSGRPEHRGAQSLRTAYPGGREVPEPKLTNRAPQAEQWSRKLSKKENKLHWQFVFDC